MPPAFWSRLAGMQGDRGCLLIGTNRVLCLKSLRDVRWDVLVIRDGYRDLWLDPEWGTRYHEELWKPHPVWKVGPANERVTHCDEFVRFEPGWQGQRVLDHNKEAAVMQNPSVVLMAANWAWLQGARELLLVGVDYHGGHARMRPPYAAAETGWAGQYDGCVPERIESYFRAAREGVKAGGGRMLNLSTASRLKALGRCRWDKVFPACESR
ncbi:MAG: hypothetical protein AMJ81_13945 [Phycisphaerae bacterium SM23_33]|nr:MAG: hypothetical protein AMJ81_13945 [Phycisphaerae bacterium SM23_33]